MATANRTKYIEGFVTLQMATAIQTEYNRGSVDPGDLLEKHDILLERRTESWNLLAPGDTTRPPPLRTVRDSKFTPVITDRAAYHAVIEEMTLPPAVSHGSPSLLSFLPSSLRFILAVF